jgi:uncharacterized SAM-binding protein YcdF (DUF218 family)
MPLTTFLAQTAHIALLPPFSLFLTMAVGQLLKLWRPRAGAALSRIAMAMLVILCTEAGARLLVRPMEDLTAPLPPAEVEAAGRSAQAIVVLAAGSLERAPEYGPADIPDNIALARLRYAAHLQHATNLPLLASGGNADPARGVQAKALTMARALSEDFRTPVRWVEPDSSTTSENAAFSAAILKPAGVQRILLVTDAMHMPRAQRAFEQAGLQVVPAPTMFYAYGSVSPWQFLPSAGGLHLSYYASYEWLGLIWYRLRE